MANSIGDMYRVAQMMGEDKRRNSPFTKLAEAVSMVANAWAGNAVSSEQNQFKQDNAYIDNIVKLAGLQDKVQDINFQNALNQQAADEGYMPGYTDFPAADALNFDSGAKSLSGLTSVAENIYKNLYSPQSKVSQIIDGTAKRPAAKVSLGKGGATYSFDGADNNDLKRDLIQSQIDYYKAGTRLRGTQANKNATSADKSYQNAVKLRDYYQKIAGSDKYNDNLRQQALTLAEDINTQMSEYLAGNIETFDITPYGIETVETGRNLVGKPRTEVQFVQKRTPAVQSPSGFSAKDKEAYNFAVSNPQHPLSAGILRRLGF
ncbi:MAG: hypothetical protein LBR69_02985 [Endomicrobium sp.]|jgi:hypothetical protein|nr:hypothetical protein [Endomicrobium sp.]